jgi:hypothetical protein
MGGVNGIQFCCPSGVLGAYAAGQRMDRELKRMDKRRFLQVCNHYLVGYAGHAQLAMQRSRETERMARPALVTEVPIGLAEPEMTTGAERPHPTRHRELQSFRVVGQGAGGLPILIFGGGQDVPCARLATEMPVLPRQVQRPLGERTGLLDVAGKYAGRRQGDKEKGQAHMVPHVLESGQGLLKHGQSCVDVSAEDMRMSE